MCPCPGQRHHEAAVAQFQHRASGRADRYGVLGGQVSLGWQPSLRRQVSRRDPCRDVVGYAHVDVSGAARVRVPLRYVCHTMQHRALLTCKNTQDAA